MPPHLLSHFRVHKSGIQEIVEILNIYKTNPYKETTLGWETYTKYYLNRQTKKNSLLFKTFF